jgi:mannose-6-phosphate isomerase-like protein (cupin superfamily)
MKIEKLKNYTGGWFLGNFLPTLQHTEDFEVAIKRYKSGDKEESHHHKIATEYTVITSGVAKMNENIISEDEIVIIEPGESVSFEAITDVCTVVVKTPSVKEDKYID